MTRLLPFLVAMAVAVPAMADTVHCTAVGAATPRVTLEADISEERDSLFVRRLDSDMGDDFTISTAGDSANRIEDQTSGDGRLAIELVDQDDVFITLRLQLVRDTEYGRLYGDDTGENWRAVVAGTLSAFEAGVWPVTCEGW
jgi:hypothetical protein